MQRSMGRGAFYRRAAFLRLAALVLLAGLLLGACGGRSGRAAGQAPAPVSPDTLRAYVSYLASDELEGRLIGTPGIAAAEEYIAGRFAEAGLEPLPGDDDYFNEFTVTRAVFEEAALEVASANAMYAGRPGVTFTTLRFCGDGEVRAPLVFAGYGIVAPEAGHDDYAGLDVRDRIVLTLRGEPDTDDPASPFYGEGSTVHAYFQTKGEQAHRRGAAAIVVVNPPGRAERPEDFALLPAYSLDGITLPPGRGGQVRGLLPALLSSSEFLAVVSGEWGVSADDLKTWSDRGEAPAGLGLAALEARVMVGEPQKESGIPARNVAAVLPGRAGTGYVVVGAHHDHLGIADAPAAGGAPGAGPSVSAAVDTIFNGADDNASGVATLLNAAAALAHADLERSVVFVTFTGEEHDLLGSIWFAATGAVPVRDVDLMLNLDMVGRNPDRPIVIYQGGELPFAGQSIGSLAAGVGLDAYVVTSGFGGSDHTPFEQSGVPVVFPFSGFHDDYHGVDDEPDRLDYERMALVTEFVVDLVEAAAVRR